MEGTEGIELGFLALEHVYSQNTPGLPDENDRPDSEINLVQLQDCWPHDNSMSGNYTPESYGFEQTQNGYHHIFCIDPFHCDCATAHSLGNELEAITQDRSLTTGNRPASSSLAGAVIPSTTLPETPFATSPALPVKVGGRFSRDSVRILKKWLATHSNNPHPEAAERLALQQQTGLNKTQIMNWLSNARRRGKMQPSRSPSPLVQNSWTRPIDIPPRRGTPAFQDSLSYMNPLERWVDSPPENEPAAATAIARAVASCPQLPQDRVDSPHPEIVANRLLKSGRASLASSVESRSSGGSLSSANSYTSQTSFGLFAPLGRSRQRRKRRTIHKRDDDKLSLTTQLKTFQCTFCTETFKTKHDWGRHENSLHLSLERWICTKSGPRAHDSNNIHICCVFCGETNPSDDHLRSHNYTACQERPAYERMFTRKDHLSQHLRLVHNVKFAEWSMSAWKVAMPAIRSRCGFCEILMETWDARVHHLADHFKTGKSMAEWKGDWGFDAHVLELVENAIPPYWIETERHAPVPFEGSGVPAESPRSAYELIKLELAYFMQKYFDRLARMPDTDEMQVEACRIIISSEALSSQETPEPPSWLKDLIMSQDELTQQAKFGPMRSATESRLYAPKINGKDSLFEGCPFEAKLNEFVEFKRILGHSITFNELKEEACHILGRIEEVSTTPSDFIATWLIKLIHSMPDGFSSFCHRAGLAMRTSDLGKSRELTAEESSTIHSYTTLEQALSKYLGTQRAMGVEPSNADLRQQARIIIYASDDKGQQTAADDDFWLSTFKHRHSLHLGSCMGDNSEPAIHPSILNSHALSLNQPPTDPSSSGTGHPHLTDDAADKEANMGSRLLMYKTGGFFLNNPNFFRWLGEELGRWVAATMSPNNPACHVPSDREIQHYARCILFNDDDCWNQTPADNHEWLAWFKRESGITKTPSVNNDEDIS
ncbi:hypothetical protein G7046_g5981 [Stylonectria norvegica]|nr:hypothetical protein G7046_g5981 [Stylonectria norvegica]